jgi:hypothetical protein
MKDISIYHKTKDRVTQTPLKHGVNSGAPEGLAVPAPIVTPVGGSHSGQMPTKRSTICLKKNTLYIYYK